MGRVRLPLKSGIKIKTNCRNLLFLFDTIDFENDFPHYLLLEDNNAKLYEKFNDTRFSFVDEGTNKTFTIKKGQNYITYENKYTLKKENPLNEALLKKYCQTADVPTNLLIQLIHNNEDIKKIVSLYVNDVIYALYAISKINKKEELVSKISPNYKIVDGIIYCGDSKYIDEDATDINDKDTYDLYQLINTLKMRKNIYGFVDDSVESIFEYIKGVSSIRNDIAHSKISQSYDLSKIKDELENYIKIKGEEFVEQNQLNIYLICQLYSNNVKEELKRYYIYILNEQDKNLGVSLNKVLEWGRLLFPSTIKNEEKLKKYNIIIRYHIYNYLTKHIELKNKYLLLLNEASLEDKDILYENLTKEIGLTPFKEVDDICKIIDFKKDYKKLNNFENEDLINELLDIKYDWLYFTLQIYSLSKFLTIKETNILISTLIKKFQSMASLRQAADVMNLNLDKYFNASDFFCSFANIDKVITQLRIINSTRRFNSWKNQTMENSFILEGLKLFKSDYTEKELVAFLEEESTLSIYKRKRIKNPFKNFIRNNVCKAKDFDFLIRYTDAQKVSNLLYHNPKLVEFLFSRFDSSLLEKYLNNGVTVESISSLTLDNLIKNVRDGNMDYSLNVKLYLKCLYVLIKNMVKINSYYFIAFSFFERDQKLFDEKYNPEKKMYNIKYNLNLLDYTKTKIKKETTEKAITNFLKLPKSNNVKNNILVYYRNLVEHLEINNIITKTNFPQDFKYRNYFKIYHYCLQKELLTLSNYNDNEFVKECLANINKYHTYSKKLLYAINAIFIYNSARYKDISAEAIFMKKYE